MCLGYKKLFITKPYPMALKFSYPNMSKNRFGCRPPILRRTASDCDYATSLIGS
jgi:hypothetical protein